MAWPLPPSPPQKKTGVLYGFIVLYVDQLYQVPSNTIYSATDVSDWSVCVCFLTKLNIDMAPETCWFEDHPFPFGETNLSLFRLKLPGFNFQGDIRIFLRLLWWIHQCPHSSLRKFKTYASYALPQKIKISSEHRPKSPRKEAGSSSNHQFSGGFNFNRVIVSGRVNLKTLSALPALSGPVVAFFARAAEGSSTVFLGWTIIDAHGLRNDQDGPGIENHLNQNPSRASFWGPSSWPLDTYGLW